MIPKIIHYCWFGRNPLPPLAEKCIGSWKKYCADYKIVEWNEDSFDIDTAPLYVRQAYEQQKWAFVTDYVRLYALFTQGGIYMDTDVEVIKPLDGFLDHKAFSGFEDEHLIPTGIMASEKDHPLVKKWMEEYDSKLFVLPDGSLNRETNVAAITRTMKNEGMKLDNTLQTVEGFTFYPKDYFCPKSYRDGRIYKSGNTVTIHHFAGSWKTEDEIRSYNQRIARRRIKSYLHPFKIAFRKMVGERVYIKIRMLLKRT